VRSSSLGGGGRNESVSDPGHGLNIAGLVRIVLQLRAKGTYVPVNDVALTNEVGAPQPVEDLLPSQNAPGVRSEEVQERLLERGEVHLASLNNQRSVQHVELEIADLQARDELPGIAVGPADNGPRPGDQIIWNERNAEVIIGAALEGVELPAQIATPGERYHSDQPAGPRFVDQPDRRTGLKVDLEQKKMRLPLGDRGPRAA